MSYHLTEAFEDQVIRISGTPDAPLFNATDVCAVLGLTYVSQAVETLDDDERALCKVLSRSADGTEQVRETWHVTESGLYHLAFKSRKSAAKRFRRWVTNEVLPAIRKNGVFHADDAPIELDVCKMPLTQWIGTLGLDLRNDARRCADMLGYVTRAANMLRWHASASKAQNKDTLFQEVPVPVLQLAEGLFIQGTDKWQIVRDTGRLPAPVEVTRPKQRILTIPELIERNKRKAELAKAKEVEGVTEP